MAKNTMLIIVVSLIAVAALVGIYMWKRGQTAASDASSGDTAAEGTENFGWWGGNRWGWGGRYRTFGFPYRRYYTSWPPYLYTPLYDNGDYYGVDYLYGPKCVSVNENSDCEPSRPVKVGQDLNNDGVKESWKCCRR